jgi:LETM1 and EF-hand domain-containing protein 1
MIPFSGFIIVPFGELGLAPYLKLFPNAMPNGFRTPLQIKEVKDELKETQKCSHKKLHKMINKYLIEQGINFKKLDQTEILKEFISKSK